MQNVKTIGELSHGIWTYMNWRNVVFEMSFERIFYIAQSVGLSYQNGLTLNPAWISNNIHYKMWGEFIYPFPNVNACSVEVIVSG